MSLLSLFNAINPGQVAELPVDSGWTEQYYLPREYRD